LQEKIEIGENETAGELHDRMKEAGAQLVVRTVQGLNDGTIQEVSQENAQYSMLNSQLSEQTQTDTEKINQYTGVAEDQSTPSSLITHHSLLKSAPKITTAICRIDWLQSIDNIHNLIRGLSPYPGAFTELGDKSLKIFRSEKEPAVPTSRPGRWESDQRTFLKFAAKDGYIHLKELQLEGKKRMGVEDFLRGFRF
jgi:methionyl-tRNA formyltransferase